MRSASQGGNKGIKKQLQAEYKRFLPKSNSDKSDKDMHINVLFKKILFSEEQDFENLSKLRKTELLNLITNHITSVIRKMKHYELKTKWVDHVKAWEKDLSSIDYEIDYEYNINKMPTEKIEEIIHNTKVVERKSKTKIINYNSNWKETKTNFSSDANKEKIGAIGEQIIYAFLVKKYGIDNVNWTSNIDKYAPYDIEYSDSKGNKHFVEVKSTTRVNWIHWYISRREISFYNDNKLNYEIFFVKDINTNGDPAIIERVKSPKIKITNKSYGIYDDEYHIMPIQYKGLA